MLSRPQNHRLAFAVITALFAFVAPAQVAAHPNSADEDVTLPGVTNFDECGGNVPSCSTVRPPVITVNAGKH